MVTAKRFLNFGKQLGRLSTMVGLKLIFRW